VTGVDESGRSTVTWQGDVDAFLAADTPVRNTIGEWLAAALPSSPNPPYDIDCPPGAIHWRVIRWAGAHESTMHRTDTFDIQTVLHGRAELVLETGSVTLDVGDCVVIPGVEHLWRVGPEGCTLNTILIGVNPRPGDDGSAAPGP